MEASDAREALATVFTGELEAIGRLGNAFADPVLCVVHEGRILEEATKTHGAVRRHVAHGGRGGRLRGWHDTLGGQSLGARRAGRRGRGRVGTCRGGIVLYVAWQVPKAFGPGERIDQVLCVDGLETLVQSFVQEGVAGLGQDALSKLVQVQLGRGQSLVQSFLQEGGAGLVQDAASNLVQVGTGHVVDDLISGGRHHGLAEAFYASPDGGWGGMVDRGVELGKGRGGFISLVPFRKRRQGGGGKRERTTKAW